MFSEGIFGSAELGQGMPVSQFRALFHETFRGPMQKTEALLAELGAEEPPGDGQAATVLGLGALAAVSIFLAWRILK